MISDTWYTAVDHREYKLPLRNQPPDGGYFVAAVASRCVCAAGRDTEDEQRGTYDLMPYRGEQNMKLQNARNLCIYK